jgi:hypothetical protein
MVAAERMVIERDSKTRVFIDFGYGFHGGVIDGSLLRLQLKRLIACRSILSEVSHSLLGPVDKGGQISHTIEEVHGALNYILLN